jgi:hypothetical protein
LEDPDVLYSIRDLNQLATICETKIVILPLLRDLLNGLFPTT